MKASVIVLSWNGMDYLEDCLKAVLSQDYANFEVIVVDNGSVDGSADLVAERFPQVQLIRNERNLGFAAGNNVGLESATGDVLVLLNQDTVVQPGWLAALVEALSADPSIGVAGGKALYPDGTIQHAGGYVNERGEGFHYGYREEDDGQFDQMRDVDYVTGASLAIARRAFDAVGPLDEGFGAAYYEDVDWCYRARSVGFRVVYVPRAVLIHEEASAASDMSYEGICLFHSNRLRIVLKHWPLDRLVNEFLLCEQTSLEHLDEGSERMIAGIHYAYLYYLLHLGDVVALRQKWLDFSLSEVDVLADMLLTLRTVVPVKPARIDPDSTPIPNRPSFVTAQERGWAETMENLRSRWAIQEHEFRSEVPFVGPLIAAFRRQWNRISTQWYVQPIIRQQSEFNAHVVATLEYMEAWGREYEGRLYQIEYDRQRLGKVMVEYVSESRREIGELAQEIRRLRTLLEKVTH
jgi:GT2 family glycosyltransferase